MPSAKQSNIGKILYLLRGINIHPAYLLIPVLLALLAAAFEGAGIGMLIPILNGFLQKNFSFVIEAPYIGPLVQMLPDSILYNDRMLFGTLLSTFIALYITKNVFKYLSVVSIGFFAERALHHLRKVLFARYLSFGKLFFDSTNVGHHSTLLLEFTRFAFRPLLLIDKYMNALFSLIVYAIVLLSISWRLTLIAVPMFFVLHIAIKTMILKIKNLSRELTERGSELGGKSIESLSTIPLIKSYRSEKVEQQNYAEISDEKAKLEFRIRALRSVVLPLQEIITLLAVAAIFVGSLYWFGRDQIASAPALIVYFYVVMNASHKFGALSGLRAAMATATGPLDEVLEIFSDDKKFFVQDGDKEFPGLTEKIEIRNLSFGYSDDREILSKISCVVHKGHMTAIVGPTGSGKSTIINILMRFYDCPPETVLIDGTDIRTFSLSSYLPRIALVSQETLLLHDSIYNNITYGLEDVSDESLQEVIERARLKEFIDALPDGLNTLIGDRGVKLSGGEKQRVSIARALLKGAEILILDEATSSLDSQTEKLIQEAIDEAVKGRTAIVIAHRLSTIKNADKIVVLEDGQVNEEGTLQELLDAKGRFFALWEEQKF